MLSGSWHCITQAVRENKFEFFSSLTFFRGVNFKLGGNKIIKNSTVGQAQKGGRSNGESRVGSRFTIGDLEMATVQRVMSSGTRSKVLSIFKTLHRSRQHVFSGDREGLQFIRTKINEEFRKWQAVQDPAKIKELINIAEESNEILRNKIIQAQEIRPKVYRLRSDQLQSNCTNARETCENCTCQ